MLQSVFQSVRRLQKCPFPWGNLHPMYNTCSLDPPDSSSQTASRSVQPFLATVCKTVRPIRSDRCLSVLSVTLVYCDQKVRWVRMPLGTEIGLGPGHIVLYWTQLSPTERGTAAPTFWPMSIVAKRLDGSGYHLVRR